MYVHTVCIYCMYLFDYLSIECIMKTFRVKYMQNICILAVVSLSVAIAAVKLLSCLYTCGCVCFPKFVAYAASHVR